MGITFGGVIRIQYQVFSLRIIQQEKFFGKAYIPHNGTPQKPPTPPPPRTPNPVSWTANRGAGFGIRSLRLDRVTPSLNEGGQYAPGD